MCGISGIFHLTENVQFDKQLIAQMNDSQIHRGTDAGDYFFDHGLALGHRR